VISTFRTALPAFPPSSKNGDRFAVFRRWLPGAESYKPD